MIKISSGKLARKNDFADFNHGFCVPASCSEQKSLEFIESYLSKADLQPFEVRCQTNDPVKLDFIDIFAM